MRHALWMLMLLSTVVSAQDVYYGIDESGVTYGQRFYCAGTLPCGFVDAGGSIYTLSNWNWYDVGLHDGNTSGEYVGRVRLTTGPSYGAVCTMNGCNGVTGTTSAEKITESGTVLFINGASAFLRDRYGNDTPLPKVEPSTGYAVTQYFALNNLGDTGGVYFSPDQLSSHGFIRKADGTVTFIDYPGAKITTVRGVNDNGVAVGYACLWPTKEIQLASASCVTGYEVGFRYDPPGAPVCTGKRKRRTCTTPTGTFTNLSGQPRDINNAGQVVQ